MILPTPDRLDLENLTDDFLQQEIEFTMLAAECSSEETSRVYYEHRLARAENELERRYLLSDPKDS